MPVNAMMPEPRLGFTDPPRSPGFGFTDLPRPRSNPRPVGGPATATTPLPRPAGSSGPGQQPFQAFYDTPLYQFPLQEGLDAVNANYAGRGMLESGAAMKAINDYAAGMAAGGMRDYFQLLGNQQAIGFNAASGQAGVGQNFANSITGANQNYVNSMSNLNSTYANNAGNAYANYGNAQSQYAQNVGNINSNAILAQANNNNAMWGGIGSALGNAAGYFAYQPYSGGSMPTSGWGTPGIY